MRRLSEQIMAKQMLLGKLRKEYQDYGGETIYLEEHSWDCSWYWGFGYIGNHRLSTHFNLCFLNGETDINKIFQETPIRQEEWWLLRDLFIQAYALKDSAEVYHYGGHQVTKRGVTDIIQSKEMEDEINKDLKIVLDEIWGLLRAVQRRVMLVNNLELNDR